jgi:hypothetical protein
MRKKRRNTANGTRFAFAVVQRNIAFGCGVKLEDLRDTKTALKLAPYVGPQAVAAAKPDPMVRFPRIGSVVDKVSAEFSDILEKRAIPFDNVLPKPARREFLSEHH